MCRGLRRRRRGKRGFSARGAWKSRLSGVSEAKWLQPDCAAVQPTWLNPPVVTWVISPKQSPRHLGELLQIGISLSSQTFFGGSISWLWVLCWVVGHLTRRRWSSIVVRIGWMCAARRPALQSWMRSLIAWGQPGRPGKTRFFEIDAWISLSCYMDLSKLLHMDLLMLLLNEVTDRLRTSRKIWETSFLLDDQTERGVEHNLSLTDKVAFGESARSRGRWQCLWCKVRWYFWEAGAGESVSPPCCI